MERLIQWHLKNWYWGLCLTIVTIFVGSWQARNLGLNSDLESLLPKKAPSVVAMNVITPKSGGSTDFRIVLEGGTLQERVAAAEEFKQFILQKHPQFAETIQYKTPKSFFEKHKYTLIPMESLQSLADSIEEERNKHPDVFDPLGVEETGSKTPSIIPNASEESPSTQSSKPPAPAKKQDDFDFAKELLNRLDKMRPYYQSENGDYLSLRIIPKMASFNINSNRNKLEEMQKIISEFNFEKRSPSIMAHIYGKVLNTIERYEAIQQDVAFGGWGIAIIFIVVALFFRSLWSLVILAPPLLAGLAAGMGVVTRLEGSLNLIAIFLVLVVFGVGIEFGIHLLSRFLQERRLHDFEFSLKQTWLTTGRATLTSAFALLAGFALLTLSSFQGFAQFGRVAIVLIVMVSGSFVLFTPSWFVMVEKIRKGKPWALSLADLLWKKEINPEPSPIRRKRSVVVIGLSLGLTLVSLVLCTMFLRFEYKFTDSIKQKTIPQSRLVLGEIYGEHVKPSAIAVFNDLPSVEKYMEFYRKNKASFPDIALVSGLSTFLPSDMEKRIEKLQEISDDLDEGIIKKIEDPEIQKALREIKNNAYEMAPYVLQDIPSEARDSFIASDKSGDYLVFLFDIGGDTDGRKSMKFAAAVDDLNQKVGMSPTYSGAEIIFADIVSRVISEGPWLVIGMFLLVFGICWLDFKRLKHAFITMAPVCFGFLLTGLWMVLSFENINFYNMVALASLGAMVVDNSIHFYHRYLGCEEGGEAHPVRKTWFSIAPTVIVCTITSICGYGGMFLANHTGIASLGRVAVVGLVFCLVSSVIVLPAWLSIIARHHEKK